MHPIRVAAIAALGVGAALPAPAAAQEVLVVGDSLGVGSTPHLRRELPGMSITADSREGRPSPEGVEVLGGLLRPEHDVVVFDLGTNDAPSAPEVLARDLDAAAALVGERCMVVATLNRPPLNGVPVDGLNAALLDFASSRARGGSGGGVEVVDWQAAALADPGLLNPDAVHPTPAGYALRGRVLADGVRACLEGADRSSRRRPGPQPRPRFLPQRRPSEEAWELSFYVTPPPLARAVVEMVEQAARHLRSALGIQPPPKPEPVLGAP